MIYCIEDDSGIRELILYTLSASGFEAKGFPKADDLCSVMKNSVIFYEDMICARQNIDKGRFLV